jgi:hypothetical protein
MNFNHRVRAVVLAVAVTAIPTASASAAQDIPAGQIEHTVTQRTVERIAPDHQAIASTVTEDWLGVNASRSVDRWADNGALLRECASKGEAWSCFDARGNVLDKGFGVYPYLPATWALMARYTAWMREHGHYEIVGTGTDIGRPVDIYHATNHIRRETGIEVEVDDTIDIDRATGYPLRWVSDETGSGETTRQTVTVTTFETLDASAGVSMAMAKHRGAKVRVVQPSHKRRHHAHARKPAHRR